MNDESFPALADALGRSAVFVGRGSEQQELADFLAANQSVSLVGLPGMGKTALLRHVSQPGTLAGLWPGGAIVCAYVDCACLQDGTPVEVFRRFAGALARSLAARALPPEPAIASAVAHPSRLAFEMALRTFTSRGVQVVLALDAFEALSNNVALGIAFFNALRAAAGRFRLSFLTASDRALSTLTNAGISVDLLSSPFFNIFANITLGPLEEGAARELIRALLSEHGVLDPAPLEDGIYALVGGYPMGLDLVCRQVTRAGGDGERLVQQASQALQPWYAACWQCLGAAEQEYLRQGGMRAWPAPADPFGRALALGLLRNGVLMIAMDGSSHRASCAWEQFMATAAAAR